MSETKSRTIERERKDAPEEPKRGEAAYSDEEVEAFLNSFDRKRAKSSAAPVQDKAPDQMPARVRAREAYWLADWESIVDVYLDPATSKADKAEIQKMMTEETGGEMALAKDGQLAMIFGEPGRERDDAISDALLDLAGKPSAASKKPNQTPRDPKRFEQLARCISPDVWNDSGSAIGAPKRGLGPKVCAGLWLKGGGYDEICKLIELGVDTTIPAQSETKGGLGVYSDYVQPLQHLVQGCLRDTSKLGTDAERGLSGERKSQVEGAAKILKALKKSGSNVTVTEWSEVTSSDLIKEFKDKPGTIWGFEDVRLPFVQASHETPQGAQPVRMMEIWEAVVRTLSPASYAKLLENPKEEIKRVVEEASQKVATKIDSEPNYAEVRDRKAEYLKKFNADATKFLTEFAAQIPRGTFARPSPDMKGVARPRVTGRPDPTEIAISDVSGIHNDKFMSSFACKAGLWWAKNEGKPVYYCLDGIDMDDVTDYKKVKNKTIEAFLSEGGPALATNPHREVVTMKEMREILKNWDELKDTVKFSLKGRILKGDELKKLVADSQSKMEKSNKEAGRTPAPPRANFRAALAQIDPSVMERLDRAIELGVPEDEVDMDARDIARKAGYLLKIAKARPEYVLKYLMSKCGVLAAYVLIPPELPQAAAKFAKLASLEPPADKKTVSEAGAELIEVLKKCPPYFRQPLGEALVRHPMIERDRKLKKALKSG